MWEWWEEEVERVVGLNLEMEDAQVEDREDGAKTKEVC